MWLSLKYFCWHQQRYSNSRPEVFFKKIDGASFLIRLKAGNYSFIEKDTAVQVIIEHLWKAASGDKVEITEIYFLYMLYMNNCQISYKRLGGMNDATVDPQSLLNQEMYFTWS